MVLWYNAWFLSNVSCKNLEVSQNEQNIEQLDSYVRRRPYAQNNLDQV